MAEKAILSVLSGRQAGQDVPIAGEVVTLGSHPSSDVRLVEPGVSRRHANILFSHGAYFLQDQRSQTGSHVNGARVAAIRLRDGDEIAVGSVRLRFWLLNSPDSDPQPTSAGAPEKPDVAGRSLASPWWAIAIGALGVVVLALLVYYAIHLLASGTEPLSRLPYLPTTRGGCARLPFDLSMVG